MKLTSLYTGGLLAVGLYFLPITSQAGIAYDFPIGLPGNVDNSVSFGYVFTVNDAAGINVTSLGLFDDNSDGFANVQMDVAIYGVTVNGDNSLVGGSRRATQVFQGIGTTAGTLLSGSSTRVKPVEAVLEQGTYILVAGTRNTAAADNTEVEQFYNRSSNPAGATQPTGNANSSITFGGNYTSTKFPGINGATTLPGTWTYDSGAAGWTPAYAAGNFDFTPVPEPVHFAMAGVGMLGLVYIGRGLWMRRKTA